MGAVLVPFVFVVVILVVVAVAAVRMTRRQQQRRTELTHDHTTLRYELPDGQDPAVVVAALTEEGYEATTDERAGGVTGVLIGTATEATEPDREQVRHVLAGANRLNFEGDAVELPRPRFADE